MESLPTRAYKFCVTLLLLRHLASGEGSYTCEYEGHLQTSKNWFGFLANITVQGSASLTYNFSYSAERSSCCQNILFLNQYQATHFDESMSCFEKERLVVRGMHMTNHTYMIHLSQHTAWSGCREIEHNDVGTMECIGRWSFITSTRPVTWYIAVSNCRSVEGLDLVYSFKVEADALQCSAEHRRDGGGEGGARPTEAVSSDTNQSSEGVGFSVETEGDVNTAGNWYGYLMNVTLATSGGFRYKVTLPYSLQPVVLILYNERDLALLRLDMSCWQKQGIIRASQVQDQMIDLNYRATWNGCISEVIDNDRYLTCEGEREFSRPNGPTKIFLAVSNCRSRQGLHLHYRFEVFGH